VVLGVDALCINESDIEERNQQVSIMGHIYEYATQVLVWVGEEAEGSHLVFQHVAEWHQRCKDFSNKVRKTGDIDDIDGGSYPLNPPQYPKHTRDAFAKLCSRKWFSRTWGVQEVALAKKVVVLCGNDSEQLWELLGPAGFYGDRHHPLRGIDSPTHTRNLKELKKGSRMKDVFKYTRFCETEDPRDEVYALLGIAEKPIMSVNYHLSVAEVYRDFTQAIIQSSQSLDVLHWFGTGKRRSDLPSWVPDYSANRPTSALIRVFSGGIYSGGWPWKIPLGTRFHENDLIIQGKQIATILDVGLELVTSPSYMIGTTLFTEVFRSWERIAVGVAPRKKFPESILHAFATVVTNSNDWDVSFPKQRPKNRDMADFVTFYLREGSGIISAAYPEIIEEMELERAWYAWAGSKYNKEDAEKGRASIRNSIETICFGRALYTTVEGSLGLAPPGTLPGDKVVFLPGGLYPFVMRKTEDGAWSIAGGCTLFDLDEYAIFKDKDGMVEYTIR